MAKAIKAITGGKSAGISEEAVRKATGKTWQQWGRLLDKDGCKTMPHKEIAELYADACATRSDEISPTIVRKLRAGLESSPLIREVEDLVRR